MVNKKSTKKPSAKSTKARNGIIKSKAKVIKKKVVLTYDQKKARWRIDPKTGKPLSRYSYEKNYGRGTRKNARQISNKFKLYISLRDDYIEKYNAKHKTKLTKRAAMQSAELRQIVSDLHLGRLLKKRGKNKQANAIMLKALKKAGRRDGVPDNIPVGETPQQGGNS